MATKYPLDGFEPSVNIGGRPLALMLKHIAVLHAILTERAQASLQEITDALYRRCRVRVCVCEATIQPTLAHKASYGLSQNAQALWLHRGASAQRRSFQLYQADRCKIRSGL